MNSISIVETITRTLEPWLNNAPSFDDVNQAYKQQGRLTAQIRRKQREIEQIEEAVLFEVDKPRSNAARITKLQKTSQCKDELAELEAQLAEVTADVKILEFRVRMFQSANFRIKNLLDGS